MRKITDIISKPSQALQAGVDGLRAQDARPGFCVSMSTYGVEINGICFGCLATCALQQLAEKNLGPGDILGTWWRAKALGFEQEDVNRFEIVMDLAREGDLRGLFRFFGLPPEEVPACEWRLLQANWREQLPAVEKTIEELRQNGY